MFKISDQPDKFLLWGGNVPLLPGDGNYAEVIEAGNDGTVTTLVPDMVTQQPAKGLSVLGPAGDTYSQKILVAGGMLVHDKRTSITKPDILWSYRVIDTSSTSPTIIVPADSSDPNMAKFRAFHTVTLLERQMSLDDQGPRLLVAGGLTVAGTGNVYFEPQDEVEFFLSWEENPASAFTVHQIKGRTIGLNEPRAGHTATTLEDGTVLIVGGFSGEGFTSISSSAEIFNPRHRNLRVE
ncbi:MAG: hypothetical protein D6806_08005 [Deltaproteobacteria bacterium]|nr:MAG: hypothetical protein D6806_08005 [Deltaproteobacteria bacterium]